MIRSDRIFFTKRYEKFFILSSNRLLKYPLESLFILFDFINFEVLYFSICCKYLENLI